MQRLLDAGATLIGKTITDEVSLGIVGENAFYGAGQPRASGRVPGGPSSVRAPSRRDLRHCPRHHTGGSVRVPAFFAVSTALTDAWPVRCLGNDAAGAEL